MKSVQRSKSLQEDVDMEASVSTSAPASAGASAQTASAGAGARAKNEFMQAQRSSNRDDGDDRDEIVDNLNMYDIWFI